MREKAQFIALPALLLLIYFLGKLVMSLLGASYEAGTRVFSMVTLQIHLAVLWGAVGRRYPGYRIGGAILVGVMIALVSQILILFGTAISYPLGGTHFNEPVALNQAADVDFGQAMAIRAGGVVGNAILGGIAAAIGWALGALIPERLGTTAGPEGLEAAARKA